MRVVLHFSRSPVDVIKDTLLLCRIFKATEDCQFVIQQCIHVLQALFNILNQTNTLRSIRPESEFYVPLLSRDGPTSPIHKTLVLFTDIFNPEFTVAVFNPLEYARTELIQLNITYDRVQVQTIKTVKSFSCLSIHEFYFQVFDTDGNELDSEIHPDLDQIHMMKRASGHTKSHQPEDTKAPQIDPFAPNPARHFILCFVATFKPLEMKHFKIVYAPHWGKKYKLREI